MTEHNHAKTRTVWAVSSGSYSDYGVSYICATEELAKTLCLRINGTRRGGYDEAFVEEFTFVEELGDARTSTVYRVQVDSTGVETRRWTYQDVDAAGGPEPEDEVYDIAHGVMANSVRGYDVALKAARDKLASLKAREAGV